MKNVLKVTGLCIRRGEREVLSHFDFRLTQGEIIVVLGSNGAGKSSLLLALAGLISAEGIIEIAGKPLPLYNQSGLTKKIAWQGDLPPTEFGLTVLQRLTLVLDNTKQNITKITQEVDITALLHRPLNALSSGERQRVELAALMLRDTPIWLLDEPTTHLDLKHQVQTINMLRKQATLGRAMLVILHDIQQATAIADHLILIDGKGGGQFGKTEDLMNCKLISKLFDAPLVQQGSILMANYGGNNEIT